MAEVVYTWPSLIQSSDTVSGYFNTPVSEITFTSIRDCFTEMTERLKDAIDVQIASDTGYYIMGAAGYEASKILAEKGLDAIYDKLKDRMDSDGEDINEYILVQINPVIHKIWKRSYQSSYESVQYSANLKAIHKDDFLNMVNNYAYTNNSFSIYNATFRYFYNSNSSMTYTHKQYQAIIISYSITSSDIASDGGYSEIYNGTTINVTNAGSNIYVLNIMGGHIEGTGTSTGSGSLYTSSCGAVFSNVLCTSRDLYNPSGTDTSTSGKYPSGEMGGLGTFDDSTDLSDISSKPSLNISDLGFFSIWNPSSAQLRNLADFVWNDPANWQQWGQIFQSGILKPLDYIISLSILPVPSNALTLSSKTFCMGGIIFDGRVTALGINLTMNQVQEQFVDIDLGTLSLKEYFGSFLDYAPYSQISIYLPFYGVAELSMNELQNADNIQLVYRINILDGSCAIKLLVDRQTAASQNGSIPLKHVLYEYYTNVKTDVPLTQGANTEHMKMAATMITAAVAMAAPIAGAGVSALAGATEGAVTIGGLEGASLGAQVGNSAVGSMVTNAVKSGAQGAQKMVNSMPSGGGMQRGNISGMSSGLLSERKPFLIVTRPIQVLPANYKELEGYTASIYTTLSALESGFVQCESVDSSGLNVTAAEKEEIVKLLNGGVYL